MIKLGQRIWILDINIALTVIESEWQNFPRQQRLRDAGLICNSEQNAEKLKAVLIETAQKFQGEKTEGEQGK